MEEEKIKEMFRNQIVDKDSAIPLYFQLCSFIENAIKTGRLKEGDKLPSEDELSVILGISRPTIRQAFKELSAKGYLQRQRSKGTVITKPKIFSKFLSELTNFYNEVSSDHAEVKTKVLIFEIVENNGEPSQILKTKKLVHLVRLRYSDDIPVVYIDTYLPYEPYKKLFQYNLEENSLYDKMQEIGYPVKSVERNLRAVKTSKEIAEYLNMDKSEPTLLSKTIGKDQNNHPVEFSVASYNSVYTNFRINLKINE